MRARWRTIAVVVGTVLFALAVVTLRVVIESHLELGRAQAALDRGDTDEGITHLGRAARWYAPGMGASSRALDRLRDVAEQEAGKGDAATALRAWETIRRAILSTRSTYTPHVDLLSAANDHIATLMAKTEPPSVAPKESEAERRAWHLARLQQDYAPSVGWSLVALFGLGGWIGAAVYFIYRAIGDDDRLIKRPALYSAAAIVVGFALFLLGLARA